MTSGGTLITVTGTNFNNVTDFKIGGQDCTTFTWVSSTSVTCIVPAHTVGAVDIYIATDGGGDYTKSGAFTYVEPVTINGVLPYSGPTGGGTEVTITGTNFGGSPIIKIGNANCNVTNLTSTTVTCNTTAHAAGKYNLTYRIGTQQVTVDDAFTYLAPSIGTVSPVSGPTGGGTEITITGGNFGGTSRIKLGGVGCSDMVITVAQITCKTPAHTAGVVDVTFSDGIYELTAGDDFSYMAPVISSVNPNYGLANGGTEITISGSGFGGDNLGGSEGDIMGVFSQGKYYYVDKNGNLMAGDNQGETQIDTSAMEGEIVKLVSGETYIWIIISVFGQQYIPISPIAILGNDGKMYVIGETGDALERVVIDGAGNIVDVDLAILAKSADLGIFTGSIPTVGGVLVNDGGQVYEFIDETGGTTLTELNTVGISCDISRVFHDINNVFSESNSVVALCSDGSMAYILSAADNPQGLDFSGVEGYVNFVIVDSDQLSLGVATDNALYDVDENGTQNLLDTVDFGDVDVDYVVLPRSWLTMMVFGVSLAVDADGKMYSVAGNGGLEPAGWSDFPRSYGRIVDLSADFSSLLTSGELEQIFLTTSSGSVYRMAVVTNEDGNIIGGGDYELYYTASNVDITSNSVGRNVKLGSGGTAAECEVESWTDTEIVCVTSAHAAGLTEVAVNNGSYNSAVMGASWDDSGEEGVNHIRSGYLYLDVYASLVNYDDEINVSVAPSAAGALSKSNRAVTVLTNNLDGYKFSVSMSGSSQDLTHKTLNAKFGPAGGSLAAPAALGNNTWGLNMNGSDQFFAIPGAGAPLPIRTTAAPDEVGDTIQLCYGFKADLSIPAGDYEGTIVYTVEVNE
jgi:hypothetical protein